MLLDGGGGFGDSRVDKDDDRIDSSVTSVHQEARNCHFCSG